jgi:uncharacterized OB-fold protein
MVQQVAGPGRACASAEPEGLLIALCPECGSYYIYPLAVEAPELNRMLRSVGAGLTGEPLEFYVCYPCGWVGNRPHYGL